MRVLLLISVLASHVAFGQVDCSKATLVQTVIGEAIEVGAPTYNDGNFLGCYRIYEGAAYKVLHLYGSKCKEARKILETALEQCHASEASTGTKAWVMRAAFDKILGVPTMTGPNPN